MGKQVPTFTAEFAGQMLETLSASEVGNKRRVRIRAIVGSNDVNSNFVRPAPREYERFAKSFIGKPFLKDHDKRIESRGGTIINSEVGTKDGRQVLLQEIELTAPWALEAYDYGFVDHFSVGWKPSMKKGDLECNICSKDWLRECKSHELGQDYDGVVCELLQLNATGRETSLVISPADDSTQVLATLSEMKNDLASRTQETETKEHEEEKEMPKKVSEFLGLADDATEDQVIETIKSQKNELSEVRSSLGLKPTATLAEVKGALLAKTNPENFVQRSEFDKLSRQLKEKDARELVARGLAEGKITAAQAKYDDAGTNHGWAVRAALSDPEGFIEFLKEAPVTVPMVMPPGDPKRRLENGKVLSLEEGQKRIAKSLGFTEKDYLAKLNKDSDEDAAN